MKYLLNNPFLIFILSLLVNASAQAAGGLVLKNADSMIRNDEKKLIELKGNVELIFKQQYLAADRATIYLDKKQIEAIGNVVIATSAVYTEAERLFFNYKTNQGVLYKGFVQNEKTLFSGEVIYKTGENTYEFKDAKYTTCKNCAPSWSFSGSKVEAEFGKNAKVTNSFLNFKDVPIFWFPYFIFPLNSKRQSGLLFPVLESSSKGGGIVGLSYYSVNSESSDSLYTLTNYETRGLKLNYNYRYALSPLDGGEIKFSYINDKLFGEEEKTYVSSYNGDPVQRWYFEYNHRYELPKQYIQRSQIFWVSDSRYPFDFPTELPYAAYPSLENRISLTNNSEHSTNYIEVVANRNLLKEDPLNTNSDAVHRFPEIQYTSNLQKIKDSNFYYYFNSSFSNFTRPDQAFDNIDDGSFATESYDAGQDKIRVGHRLIMNPQIFYPIKRYKYFDILPKLSLQSNLYQFGVPNTTLDYLKTNPNAASEKNTAGQHKLEAEISIQTRFSKVFNTSDKLAYRHEMVPSITYTQTPWIQKDAHSFFSDADEDFLENSLSISDDDSLQFDYRDQLFDRRKIRLGLTNNLTKRIKGENNSTSYTTTLFWDLYQSYDFKEDNQPLSDLTSITRMSLGHYSLNTELHYYPYQNVTNTKASITFNSFTNSYISLGYESRFEVRKNQPLDRDTKAETIDLKIFYDNDDFRFGGKSSYSLVTNEIGGLELGFTATPAGECWRFGATHSRPITGAAVTKFIFELLFDGKSWTSDELRKQMSL